MKLKKGGNSDFPRLEEGTYPSRVVQIVGLGSHLKNEMYSKTDECGKVLLTFEYPTELLEISGDKVPRFQSVTMNIIGGDRATLTKVIMACDPDTYNNLDDDEDYELSNLLGKPCITEIGSTSGDKAKIVGFMKPMKGMKVPKLMSELVYFDFYEPDVGVYNELMEWVQKSICKALDFEGSDLERQLNGGVAPTQVEEEEDSQVPF